MKATIASLLTGVVAGSALLLCSGTASAQSSTSEIYMAISANGEPINPATYNGGPLSILVSVYPQNDGFAYNVDHKLFSKYPTNSYGGNYGLLGSQQPGALYAGAYRTSWQVSIAQGTADVYFKAEANPYKLIWQGYNVTPQYRSEIKNLITERGPYFGYPTN